MGFLSIKTITLHSFLAFECISLLIVMAATVVYEKVVCRNVMPLSTVSILVAENKIYVFIQTFCSCRHTRRDGKPTYLSERRS